MIYAHGVCGKCGHGSDLRPSFGPAIVLLDVPMKCPKCGTDWNGRTISRARKSYDDGPA